MVPLLLLCALRWFGLDSSRTAVLVVTFLPWLLLPAYLLLGLGIGARHGTLTATAALVVFSHAVWTAAELPASSTAHAASSDATTIRVHTANVFKSNPNVDDAFDEALASGADVIAMQEITSQFHNRLSDHELFDAYRHQFYDVLDPVVLLSRHQITDGGFVRAWRDLPWISVEIDGHKVTFLAVHTVPPSETPRWVDDLAVIDRWVERQDGRVVLLGDFNATTQHRQFREVVTRASGDDLRDAHLEAGKGWGATWPADMSTPPLIRIDHILVGGDLAVTELDIGDAAGSDHRPLTATVQINPDS
jgi:endonuclease/exonuclease/phosphatase (EEP) superfamily protein YafD